MAADDERYDHGGKFMNYATFESPLCGTFKSQLCVPQDIFEDLGDLLLPNPSNSISWDELELDSDGEIRYVGDFEQNPGSPTLIFNDFGGDGTAEKNARKEEVKGRKFRLELSKKVGESNRRSLDVQRQQWQDFPRVVPNFPDSPSSGSKLALDSDGKIWSGDAFERNPVSPTLILNNNGGDGTVEEISREEKLSPTFLFNNNGGNGTVQENTREEEVKERQFSVGISKKVCKSSHLNFGCRRQKSGNIHRISPNFPLGGEIRWSDDSDRAAVSTTFFLNDNGGNGTVEENTWDDEAPDFSEKAPKSNHWSSACRRQQLYPPRRCTHCLSENTPQWRAGPMGPTTLCNACGIQYKSGRLLPEYRPAGSPTFDSLKHSNFHRKIARNLIRNQTQGLSR